MAADSIRATKAVIEFGGNLAPLEKKLKEASKAVTDWGKSIGKIGIGLAAAGAAVTAPFLVAMEGFQDVGSEISRTARITGMSFGEVQDAMNGTKASAEELQTASRVMSSFLVDVAQGSPQATRLLDDLGVSFTDLSKASAHERLLMLADGISKITDSAKRLDAQKTIFGRGFMGSNLTGGAAGIRERAVRAEEIGGKLSNDDVNLAKDLARAQKELGASAKGIWNQIGAAAAPIMIRFFKLITDIQIAVRKWAEANRPLLTTIFDIADKMVLLGGIIGGVGAAVIGIGAAISFIMPGLAVLGSIFGAIFSVAAIKIIAVVVVLAAVGYGLYALYEAIPAIGEFFSAWGPIIENFAATFMQVWGGISDAIAAGDFALAFEISILGMQLMWTRFANYVRDAWFSAKYLLIDSFGDIYNAGVEIFFNLAGAILKAFVTASQKINEVINGIVSNIPEWILELLGISPGAAIGAIPVAELNAEIDREVQGRIAANRVDVGAAGQERLDEQARAAQEEAGVQGQLDLAAWLADNQRQQRLAMTAAAAGATGQGLMQNIGSAAFSTGGFSAQAVLGSLGGATDEKILAASERTADATEEIRDLAREGGVAQ